jgi:phosphatidylglycerophosphate synthase
MLAMILSFFVREGVVGFFSAYTFKKTKKVTSARWFGKINTVILYGVMCALLLFPTMHPTVAEGMIWFSTVLMQLSLIGYVLFYCKRLSEHREGNGSDPT